MTQPVEVTLITNDRRSTLGVFTRAFADRLLAADPASQYEIRDAVRA